MRRKRRRYLRNQKIRLLSNKASRAKSSASQLDSSFTATKERVNKAVSNGINSINSLVYGGKVKSGRDLDRVNNLLNQQLPKQKQTINNAITQIAAHNAGVPTTTSKNGNKRAFLRNASADQKNAYYGIRRKLSSNRKSFFSILSAYEKQYGDSSGKVANSDQVIDNISDYVNAGGSDDSVIDDIFNKVNNI